MKPEGYPTDSGYRGKIDDTWMLFSTEEEYLEYLKNKEDTQYETSRYFG